MTKQDIDLQKIEVLENSYQAWFNFRASILAGAFVGILILIASLEFQAVISLYAMYGCLIILIVGSSFFIQDMREEHDKFIDFINGLVEKLEKGERLNSIEKLREEHKKGNRHHWRLKVSDGKT